MTSLMTHQFGSKTTLEKGRDMAFHQFSTRGCGDYFISPMVRGGLFCCRRRWSKEPEVKLDSMEVVILDAADGNVATWFLCWRCPGFTCPRRSSFSTVNLDRGLSGSVDNPWFTKLRSMVLLLLLSLPAPRRPSEPPLVMDRKRFRREEMESENHRVRRAVGALRRRGLISRLGWGLVEISSVCRRNPGSADDRSWTNKIQEVKHSHWHRRGWHCQESRLTEPVLCCWSCCESCNLFCCSSSICLANEESCSEVRAPWVIVEWYQRWVSSTGRSCGEVGCCSAPSDSDREVRKAGWEWP